jgi:hypothetical protein
VAAALGPTREGRALLPGNDRRPADVFIPMWRGGRDIALDVTVTHPMQKSMVQGAAAEAGHAVRAAHKRKMDGAAEECAAAHIVFRPLAVETLGGWHPMAVAEVTKLAAALARQTGEDEEVATRQLWQRLGVQLQKGNSVMITNRMPTAGFPDPTIDGTL